MKNEIKPLTGIRGIAACSVMLYHLSHIPPFARFNLALFSKGYLCVDLFFVLSGFVMAHVYHASFIERTTWENFQKFLFNRIARIYPLHIVVTVLLAVRLIFGPSAEPQDRLGISDLLANIFMINGWGFAKSIVANSWSVSTEVLAYLLFPLLVQVAFSKWRLLLVVFGVISLGIAANSQLGGRGPLDLVAADSTFPLLRCIAGFCLGLSAYRLSQSVVSKRWLSRDVAVVLLLIVLAVLFAIPNSDVAVVAVFPLLIATLYYNNRVAATIFGNPVVHHLGVVSYSIYLWHPFFRDQAGHALEFAKQHGVSHLDWLFALCAIVSSWLASWGSYKLIEVNGRKFLNRFRKEPALSGSVTLASSGS